MVLIELVKSDEKAMELNERGEKKNGRISGGDA